MHHRLEAAMRQRRHLLVAGVASLLLVLPLGVARGQVPCSPSGVTATLDSTASVVTVDQANIQCNSVPASLTIQLNDLAPFFDFVGFSYSSGPSAIEFDYTGGSCGLAFRVTLTPGPFSGTAIDSLAAPCSYTLVFPGPGTYTVVAFAFAFNIGNPIAAPKTFTVTVTACPGPPLTAVTVATNEDCDPTINPNCSANIVLANGSETTEITTTVQPPQAITVNLSADFGSVDSMVTTDSSGAAISDYMAGSISFGSTSTTVAELSAKACGKSFPNVADIFNYNGFNFHQSQVTDGAFIDSGALSEAQIQAFFVVHGSFLAHFILVGLIGGFEDLNGNGALDPGEPIYLTPFAVDHGLTLRPHVRGERAATIFAREAMANRVNPKVLLATAQKEQGLIINRPTLPDTDTLNFAMACGAATNFVAQVDCAASAFRKNFDLTPSEPTFFKVVANLNQDVQQFVTGLGNEPVGFLINTRATYAQYKYTPHIQSLPNGGGVYLFEILWKRFGF